MVILGIDPGTAITGYGAVEYVRSRCRALGYGSIRTEATQPTPERLLHIYNSVCGLIDLYRPEALSVERLFYGRNVQSAMAVGQARGVVIVCASQHGVPVYEYTPTAVKLGVTGEGRATKEQVQYMIKALLDLDEAPRPDDVADALGLAICHALVGSTAKAWQSAREV